VVTTNLPFARWSEVFLDPTAAAAVIDRIVHHATVLQTAGSSYRLAAAKRNQTPAPDDKEPTR
jgi:DNA replication protein DnaC